MNPQNISYAGVAAILATALILILGTILGVWYRLFWAGWVLS